MLLKGIQKVCYEWKVDLKEEREGKEGEKMRRMGRE